MRGINEDRSTPRSEVGTAEALAVGIVFGLSVLVLLGQLLRPIAALFL